MNSPIVSLPPSIRIVQICNKRNIITCIALNFDYDFITIRALLGSLGITKGTSTRRLLPAKLYYGVVGCSSGSASVHPVMSCRLAGLWLWENDFFFVAALQCCVHSLSSVSSFCLLVKLGRHHNLGLLQSILNVLLILFPLTRLDPTRSGQSSSSLTVSRRSSSCRLNRLSSSSSCILQNGQHYVPLPPPPPPPRFFSLGSSVQITGVVCPLVFIWLTVRVHLISYCFWC